MIIPNVDRNLMISLLALSSVPLDTISEPSIGFDSSIVTAAPISNLQHLYL